MAEATGALSCLRPTHHQGKTGWHNHHIQWRVYGGSDDLDNRVLLHPNCHQQVHSPDYDGVVLRPHGDVREA